MLCPSPSPTGGGAASGWAVPAEETGTLHRIHHLAVLAFQTAVSPTSPSAPPHMSTNHSLALGCGAGPENSRGPVMSQWAGLLSLNVKRTLAGSVVSRPLPPLLIGVDGGWSRTGAGRRASRKCVLFYFLFLTDSWRRRWHQMLFPSVKINCKCVLDFCWTCRGVRWRRGRFHPRFPPYDSDTILSFSSLMSSSGLHLKLQRCYRRRESSITNEETRRRSACDSSRFTAVSETSRLVGWYRKYHLDLLAFFRPPASRNETKLENETFTFSVNKQKQKRLFFWLWPSTETNKVLDWFWLFITKHVWCSSSSPFSRQPDRCPQNSFSRQKSCSYVEKEMIFRFVFI